MSEDNRAPSDYLTGELLDILGVDCDWAASEVRDRIASLESRNAALLDALRQARRSIHRNLCPALIASTDTDDTSHHAACADLTDAIAAEETRRGA